MKKNEGVKFVTFQIKPCEYARLVGCETHYYAVKCNNDEEVREILSDACSIDGVTYLRVNNGKSRMNKRQILSVKEYKETF